VSNPEFNSVSFSATGKWPRHYHRAVAPVIHRARILCLMLLCGFFGMGCSDTSSPVSRDVHTTRCIGDVSAHDGHDFRCDGVSFKVMLTQACIERPCGLIVDVHGWLSNPDMQESRSNLARLAAQRGGYIVVQPGELSTPSSWDPAIHYDIVFDFMQQAIDAFGVDRNRVHFTGFSQGGQMTWKFICDHSDIIASAVPISSPELYCFLNGNGPSRKVPILYISGTTDIKVGYHHTGHPISVVDSLLRVLYDYGMSRVDSAGYTHTDSGDFSVDEFGKLDVAVDEIGFEVLGGSMEGSYFWSRYTGADGIPFEHLRHSNGHVYPDNPDSLIFPEDPAVWFSVGEAILQFFIDNPQA
jgi:poly(3-hydroxybutyrate) depolymerase